MPLKILHTSDWHLGQKFLYRDRDDEHELALAWLSQTIIAGQVDVLIVAGDIFDISNPPNTARSQYYRFLTSLMGSCCRHIVLIAGNHDSPAMLNAPKELLKALHVHVVSAVTDPPDEQILLLKDRAGRLEAVVAAVPFLRDRDLKYSVGGEGGRERMERIKAGIRKHYRDMEELVSPYRDQPIPVLTTGHLFATGAEASDKQDNIYIGSMENIAADQFPEVFDYVALGHIHRPQALGNIDHVRYSGSLIPLSFSETRDEKSVYLVEFEGKTRKEIKTIPVPTFRRLKTIQGNLKKVEDSLNRFAGKADRRLTPWVEVIVETDQIIPQLDMYLKELTGDFDLELLKIRILRNKNTWDEEEVEDLHALEVLDVFRKKCESFGSPPEEMQELEATFRELQSWLQQEEEEL